MKQKTILLELLRWLCAGLAVVFLVVSFRQEPVSSAAFENVASAVTASIDLSALQEGSVQMVKRLYGLNPSDFDNHTHTCVHIHNHIYTHSYSFLNSNQYY